MIRNFIFLILFVSLVSAGSIHYTDCGSKAEIKDVRVSNCDTPPCIFYKNQVYDVEIDVVATSSSNTLPYKVTATVFEFPITLLKGDACDSLSVGKCPAQTGEAFTYKTIVKVDPSFPSVSATIKAKVKDDNQNTVICVQLKVKIKSAKTNWRHRTILIKHWFEKDNFSNNV